MSEPVYNAFSSGPKPTHQETEFCEVFLGQLLFIVEKVEN